MSTKQKRGFAAIPLDRRKEISRIGGQSVARENRVFARNPEMAREAGRKGGHRRREANSQEVKLLRESLNGRVHVPVGASGRMQTKVSRLMRLGYWYVVDTSEASGRDFDVYGITQLGVSYLATLDAQDGVVNS